MPGFLYHIACANRVISAMQTNLPQEHEYNAFLIGNLIPDLVTDKQASHYQIRGQGGFATPDLKRASYDLSSRLENLYYAAGIYCHLVLDYVFITNILGAKYTLVGDVVTTPYGQTLPLKDFRSGVHANYSAYNYKLIASENISIADLFEMKGSPPKNIFSNLNWQQNNLNWQEEIQKYLNSTGNSQKHFFTFDDVLLAIREASDIFIRDCREIHPQLAFAKSLE